ncbi:AraC-type DNA-binding protein [Verrucomicrobium sp. GAS474]|uniref:helix-turn-helix domain-containing protein n=1 Tax=Verrucomicrobium sp. GAS474 TaxID=1882831 RepID=UPI000879DFAC|nr:helix-turn-helix domain-containing protein [Verrucomicrobium sp. GAS474]SDT98886.1 AraC-type DNA-binding protein [Verrucomicrobium sp. GAS474]
MIDLDGIRIEYLEAGRGGANWPDGWSHRKIVPFAIFAEATQGAYEATVGGKTVRATAGEILFIPPNAPVTFVHHWGRKGHFLGRWLHLRATLHGTVDVTELLALPALLQGSPARLLGLRTNQVMAAAGGGALWEALHRQELAFKILRELGEAFAARGDWRDAQDRLLRVSRFRPVFEYVRNHLAEPLTVAGLARTVSLSPSRFLAAFKEAMGLSPMAYVQQARLALARQRLLADAPSIAAVAEETGFVNQFHFSRVFKTRFGITPSRYRTTHRQRE